MSGEIPKDISGTPSISGTLRVKYWNTVMGNKTQGSSATSVGSSAGETGYNQPNQNPPRIGQISSLVTPSRWVGKNRLLIRLVIADPPPVRHCCGACSSSEPSIKTDVTAATCPLIRSRKRLRAGERDCPTRRSGGNEPPALIIARTAPQQEGNCPRRLALCHCFLASQFAEPRKHFIPVAQGD